MYNLLKLDAENHETIEEYKNFKQNVDRRGGETKVYEEFLLSCIPGLLSENADRFAGTPYQELYNLWSVSRDLFYEKFNDLKMQKHVEQFFPSPFLLCFCANNIRHIQWQLLEKADKYRAHNLDHYMSVLPQRQLF